MAKPKMIRQTPAEAVIEIFGGGAALAQHLGCHRTRIYRWTMPIDKRGTGGRLPGTVHADLLALAARLKKPEVTPELLINGRLVRAKR
ncbi:MAG TPA: hypothetical protein VNK91_02110 [Burkholderiaceae bacterium]|nr:hypothetical protein [Burkholderiaceae bacterium]